MLTMIVFEGGPAEGSVERWLTRVRSALAEQLVAKGLSSGAFGNVVVVSDRQLDLPTAVKRVNSQGLVPFRFGDTLSKVLEDPSIKGFCYFSGGSAPLYSPEDLAAFAKRVSDADGGIVANNAFSADFFGTADKAPFLADDLPPQDNSVPIYLSERGRAGLEAIPFSPEASFDIDTPTDALVLALSGRCGREVETAIAEGSKLLPAGRMEKARGRLFRAKELMHSDLSDITLTGRVGPAAVMELNRLTRCRYRVFSEERGMRSFGRDEEGTARTLFSRIVAEKGELGLLEDLTVNTEALLFDDRVLFAATGAKPGAEERFLSDLMAWELMPDGLPRRLAEAACHIDGVALGGHSLVNSGAVVLAR